MQRVEDHNRTNQRCTELYKGSNSTPHPINLTDYVAPKLCSKAVLYPTVYRSICGSLRCSKECFDKWSRKKGMCLMRSFKQKPPDIYFRGSVHTDLTNKELTQIESSMRRWLSRNGIAYVSVLEWQKSHKPNKGRHLQLVLFLNGRSLTPSEIRQHWIDTVPAPEKPSSYAKKVDNPVGLARYIVKHCKKDCDVPPIDSPHRIFNASKNALTKPMPDLWKDIQVERKQRREHYAQLLKEAWSTKSAAWRFVLLQKIPWKYRQSPR